MGEKPIKWIVIDNEIRLSTCIYHRDLLHKNERDKDVVGGGIMDILPDRKVLLFHGESKDFGRVSPKEFDKALQNEESISNIRFVSYMVGKRLYPAEIQASTIDEYEIVFEP